MTQVIYILIDSDGETICGFIDKNIAIKEAEETGCDYTTINLYS